MVNKFLNNLKKKTLIGIGPMSLNCINSTIEISKDIKTPLMLIPSRRQIDYNSGYVGNLNTKKFSEYVKSKSNILLCRDHGGPWQSDLEKNMSLNKAMKNAKKSYENDISSNFKILHLDPSLSNNNNLNIDKIIYRIEELYEHCWSFSSKLKKKVMFEIGTEEQSGLLENFESYEYTYNKINKFCEKHKIRKPIFFVVQFGTKVMEDKNIGIFKKIKSLSELKHKNKEFIKINDFLRKKNIFTKIHNADYLNNEHLNYLKKCRVGAINVAPEFGVLETRSFIKILKDNKLNEILKNFLKFSYDSKKWEKWAIDKNKISKYKCAELAGHYVFSTKQFQQIKSDADLYLRKRDIHLNTLLKNSVKYSIYRYIKALKLT